jgi:GGDEF domain-containing protein
VAVNGSLTLTVLQCGIRSSITDEEGAAYMDVNRAQASQPLGGDAGRKQQRRPGEPEPEHEPEEGGHDRTAEPAVELDSIAGGMTPEALAAFEKLAAELEPMRRRLAVADARIEELRAVAGRHAFLDLPNRREFLRELGYVIGHAGDMTPPPALALVHLRHAEDFRLRKGRAALDDLLVRAQQTLQAVIGPSDALGSIGGSDFGVILLLAAGEDAASKAEAIRAALAKVLPEGVEACISAHALRVGTTPELALEAADRVLRNGDA